MCQHAWATGLLALFIVPLVLYLVAFPDLVGAATFASGGLLGWLREKVYRQGGRYPARRLIERVTGAPPDHRPLVDGLRTKYGELYAI